MDEFTKNLKNLDSFKDFLERLLEIEKDYSKKLSNLRKFQKENREISEFFLDLILEKSNNALNSSLEISSVLKNLDAVITRKNSLKASLEVFLQNFTKENDNYKGKIKNSRENYVQKCDQVQLLQLKLPKISVKKMDKSKKELNSKIIDMNNYKNLYLIEISSVNSTLKTLYTQILPEISQNVKESSKTLVLSLLKVNSEMESSFRENLKENSNALANFSKKLKEIKVQDYLPDSEYNIKLEENEGEFTFEDSGLWKDKGEVVLDENSRIFLWNTKEKLESRIGKVQEELQVLDNGIDGLNSLMNAYTSDEKNKDEVDVVEEKILESKRSKLLLMLSLSYYSNQLKEVSPHVSGNLSC